MFMRLVVVLLVGLGLTGLVGVYLMSQQQTPPVMAPIANAPPPPVHVVVSARPVRAGSLIVPEDLEVVAVDQDKLVPGTLRDSPDSRQKLRGAMMRHSLGVGEPFVAGDFLSPGDRGFLAAVLEPGMRAETIGVDAITGTAGLIWPGDRVDVLLTQIIDDQSLPTDHRVAGSTLMESVRVIAVDQQLIQGGQAGANGQGANRTVTLEVSPVDAERIEVGARLGRLSLAVHPATQVASDPGVQADAPQPVFGGDVSPQLPAYHTSKAEGTMVKVFLGGGQPVEYKFASADDRHVVSDRHASLEAVVEPAAVRDNRSLRHPAPVHGAAHKPKHQPLEASRTQQAPQASQVAALAPAGTLQSTP